MGVPFLPGLGSRFVWTRSRRFNTRIIPKIVIPSSGVDQISLFLSTIPRVRVSMLMILSIPFFVVLVNAALTNIFIPIRSVFVLMKLKFNIKNRRTLMTFLFSREGRRSWKRSIHSVECSLPDSIHDNPILEDLRYRIQVPTEGLNTNFICHCNIQKSRERTSLTIKHPEDDSVLSNELPIPHRIT